MAKVNKPLKARIFLIKGTQSDFADAVGCHESFVSQVINRRRPIPADQIQKWAKVLKCKPSEIFPDA